MGTLHELRPPRDYADPYDLINDEPDGPITAAEWLVAWGRQHGELFVGVIVGFALCLFSLVAIVQVAR